MKLSHFFIPHPETHKKAHLISWQALVFYTVFFIVLQVGFSILSVAKPDVLGISSLVDQKQLIQLTNQERAKLGLSELVENEKLDQAAAAKAQNMFAEDYWAHYSPSGKDPWGFINGAGYKFSYAGENLARNFYNSPDVVNAWMASPSHKDNIVNSKYKEIGMAVVEGTLKGQKTILVVQEFGTPSQTIAAQPVEFTQEQLPTPATTVAPVVLAKPVLNPIEAVAGIEKKSTGGFSIDPHITVRNVGISIIFIVLILLSLDLYIIRRRGVVRLSSSHLPHMAFLSLGASTLLTMHSGSIL